MKKLPVVVFASLVRMRYAASARICGVRHLEMSTPGIGPAEAFARSERGELALLDVRGSAEYAAGHVPGARHIPLGDLAARAGELPRDRPLALYCSGGTRARIGVSVLRRAGFTDLLDQGEGFAAHVAAGLPVE